MKIYLYMEVSVNGRITAENDQTDWISTQAWESYVKTVQQMDAIIIGKRTYESMPEDEFQKEKFYVVVSHKTPEHPKTNNILFTDRSPEEILSLLKEKKYKNICVAGGEQINTQFLMKGLIDEVYLDVEPVLLGKGKQIFSPDNFRYSLQLLDHTALNENTIQLHYKVIK